MRAILALAVMALLLLPLAGLGTRAGLWEFRTGFLLLRIAAYGGLAIAAAALVLAVVRRRERSTVVLGLLAALLAGTATFIPWNQRRLARALPFIHDVTTDTEDPPAFEAVVPLRAGAPNPPEYGGAEVAAKQRAGYPDLAPLRLADAPPAVFPRVLAAVRRTGWSLVAADSAAGRIEATATTRWFGFRDDVVLRLRPAPDGGTVLDMRSKSRVGGSDVGANARRIRAFLAALR